MVIEAMQGEPDAEGFFISGFPRDIVQAQGFEERVSVYAQIKFHTIWDVNKMLEFFDPLPSCL